MLSPHQALHALDQLAASTRGTREDHALWSAAIASLSAAIASAEQAARRGGGDADEVTMLRARLEDAQKALEATREAPAGDTLDIKEKEE